MSLQRVFAEINLEGLEYHQNLIMNLSDFSVLPTYMDDVVSVTVPKKGCTEWEVSLEGAPFHWIERDSVDFKNRTVQFELLDGDLDKFEGAWRMQEKESGLVLSLEIEYSLGIPVIEMALGEVLKEKFQNYVTQLVSKMGQRLLELGGEEVKENLEPFSADLPKTDKISIYKIKENKPGAQNVA